MRHGWIIRHKLSGSFIDATNPEFPQLVADATKATLFPTSGKAWDAVQAIRALPLMGNFTPDFAVEDRTFHDAPPADENPEPVVSRAEILDRAYRDGDSRRVAHAKARRLFAEQPSAQLIRHPDDPSVVCVVPSVIAPHPGFPDEPRAVSL